MRIFVFHGKTKKNMSDSLRLKINELSPEAQKEVEKFVNYLQYKAAEAGSVLSWEEEAELEQRLWEMKENPGNSIPADQFLAERKARYGR